MWFLRASGPALVLRPKANRMQEPVFAKLVVINGVMTGQAFPLP